MKARRLIVPIIASLAMSTPAYPNKVAYLTDMNTLTCSATQPTAPDMSFERMEYDFGTLKFKSHPQTVSFEFTNTGKVPLVITDVYRSCSCLSVKYPRRPVQPGEKAVIAVTYTPNKYLGDFNNYVKIYSNAEQQYVLFVRGNVIK